MCLVDKVALSMEETSAVKLYEGCAFATCPLKQPLNKDSKGKGKINAQCPEFRAPM